jgi:hypothetical protein
MTATIAKTALSLVRSRNQFTDECAKRKSQEGHIKTMMFRKLELKLAATRDAALQRRQ